MPPQLAAVLARERGIDFALTPEVEGGLRGAGATAALMATLRELAPKPPGKTPRRVGRGLLILRCIF